MRCLTITRKKNKKLSQHVCITTQYGTECLFVKQLHKYKTRINNQNDFYESFVTKNYFNITE